MSKYIALGLLAYWAGRNHRALSRRFCWNRLRREALRMARKG